MNSVFIARSSAIAARLLGDEMIIMSAKDSTLFTLNGVGTAIWQAADGTTPLAEIVKSKVCVEFDVDPETAYKDTLDFAEDLARLGILTISKEPISKSDSAETR